MSFSHNNELELRSFRRLKSYIATFSRPHLCAIPPTLVGRLFKESIMDDIVDDKGRSAVVDTEVNRVLTTCYEAWKDASLCCTRSTKLFRETPKLITEIYEQDKSIEEVLDEYDKSREIQELE